MIAVWPGSFPVDKQYHRGTTGVNLLLAIAGSRPLGRLPSTQLLFFLFRLDLVFFYLLGLNSWVFDAINENLCEAWGLQIRAQSEDRGPVWG